MKKIKSFMLMSLMAMLLLVTSCGNGNNTTTNNNETTNNEVATPAEVENTDQIKEDTNQAEVVLRMGFENSMSEPFSQGVQKWAELIQERSNGSMRIELYPDSQLGAKTELIDSMLLGEPVATLADGAFYADYGVKDFGIVFGPFLFDSWDQAWKLVASDWYAEQSKLLEEKGLKLISSNWKYGDRHTLTVKPVEKVEDLNGMKIRVPSNKIQSLGFDELGATSVGMDLGDVYQSLQTKTIDGAENPVSTLYGRKLHEVAKNLTLDGHVKNFTTLVCSADWFNSLTPEQQELLVSTADEAAEHNNKLQEEAEKEYIQLMKDEGVNVIELSGDELAKFKDKAMGFYQKESEFGWTPGLYETVKKAME